jgi:hypothetical protein
MTKKRVHEMRTAVLGLFKPGVALGAGDVQERLGLNRHRATLAVSALVAAKRLRRSGQKAATVYRLTPGRP